jgi:N6-L-threonylcarbamoyladenine synthase
MDTLPDDGNGSLAPGLNHRGKTGARQAGIASNSNSSGVQSGSRVMPCAWIPGLPATWDLLSLISHKPHPAAAASGNSHEAGPDAPGGAGPYNGSMLVLGIETSCDETAVGVVADGRRLLANVVASQAAVHARYGGVVPEVASRHHLEAMLPVVRAALQEAGCRPSDLDAVAVTAGPGLAGSLLVGLNTAKALAYGWSRPLIAVNHLEGHIYANWLSEGVPELPAIVLIVSGGHSEIVLAEAPGRYRLVGRTRDDAAGEAFDKTARLLGLGFPGGPAIEREARGAGARPPRLPRAWLGQSSDFSFSGLKTAVARLAAEGSAPVADIAAGFQTAVVDVLTRKTVRAVEASGACCVLLSGGVAANGPLRAALRDAAPVPVWAPPPILCTDNGAMIAAAAHYRAESGAAGLDLDVRAAWPVA